ncbi:pathogenesis-related protein 1B [Arachis duranensis]|uniref:Pathogenesis-related protein 1B n=1 Tax=Arachis duranensis TaxID=130453 RepID=A0A6P4CKM5_ARADU|nr:pathogenesis-related protein 1B [Arachis duranensis]
MGRLHIVAVVTSFITVIPLCLLAQNSPQDYLEVHNIARAEVGVNPLLWDNELASQANTFLSKHIVDCLDRVSISPHPMYGQNSLSSPSKSFTGAFAVAWWVAQKQNYDYRSNTCIGNPANCVTYTQVVSKSSTYVGCARANCLNGGTLVICYYHPPGNILGTRPY